MEDQSGETSIIVEAEGIITENETESPSKESEIEQKRDEEVITIDFYALESIRLRLEPFAGLSRSEDPPYTIFRLPAHVRKRNKVFCEPRVVSIGPYHRGKRHLRAIEEHKWRYLSDFLSRDTRNNLEEYMKAMKSLEGRARRCYFERPDLSSKKFTEMLLLDGSFIIEFLLKRWFQLHNNITDRMFGGSGLVLNDVTMLENQIPFCVLENLYNLLRSSCTEEMPSLVVLVDECLVPNMLEPKRLGERTLTGVPAGEDFHHLLHLCHYCIVSRFEPSTPIEPSLAWRLFRWCTICPGQFIPFVCTCLHGSIWRMAAQLPKRWCNPGQIISFVRISLRGSGRRSRRFPASAPQEWSPASIPLSLVEDETRSRRYGSVLALALSVPLLQHSGRSHFTPLKPSLARLRFSFPAPPIGTRSSIRSTPDRPSGPRSLWTIPCARELQEAGVTFKAKKSTHFLDVTFKKGVLEIPSLLITDPTKGYFMNLLAHEQCTEQMAGYFTSYTYFLGNLINTSKDVAILQQCEIIENMLASEDDLALFINNLSEQRAISEHHYLADLFEQLTKYSQSSWHKQRARMVRDYFSNPWAIISLAAAIALLALTILQTTYTIYPYYHPRS